MNFNDFGLTLGAGRRLILAGIRLGWLWAVVGAAALVLVLVLYRYERRLVSRRTGLTLLTMRVVAALALVAALFEPIARTTYREVVRGRVIVGVDLSESMATSDPGRSDEARKALAKELDLSPTESPATITRREVERRLLAGPWMKGVAEGHDVEVIGFAREASPGSAASIAGQLARPIKSDDPASLATDWDAGARIGPEGEGRGAGARRRLTDGRPTQRTGRSGPAGRSPGGAGSPCLSGPHRIDEGAERCGHRRD